MPKSKISIPLGTGSYETIASSFSAQRCVNLYAGAAQSESLSDFYLHNTPGIVSFAAAGTRIVGSRGAIVMRGVFYFVAGTVLYSIDSDAAVTTLGTIAGTARVSMAHNGTQLCIVVPNGNAYVWNETTDTLTQITDGDFLTSDTVVFKDGYYIFSETAGTVFFISNLNDPLSYTATDTGTAELSPDLIKAVHVSHDELYVMGEETTEVFQNIGGADFPFQRIPGASFEKGVHSKYSMIQWEGFFYFLGGGVNEKTCVWRAGGGSKPVKVSTDAIDYQIQKFTKTEIGNAFSFSYSIGGFSFVGFTFRSINTDNRTFIYNVTASQNIGRPVWFEQQSGVDVSSWRINSVHDIYDKLLVTDKDDGRIGYLSETTYTEYGNVILREKVTGPLSNVGIPFYIPSLELVVQSGNGLISGQGSDPLVMMDYSDDGARTFSSDTTRTLGKIGEYFRKAVWRRLGRSPSHRVFRFRVSDPVPVTMIRLDAEVESGV